MTPQELSRLLKDKNSKSTDLYKYNGRTGSLWVAYHDKKIYIFTNAKILYTFENVTKWGLSDNSFVNISTILIYTSLKGKKYLTNFDLETLKPVWKFEIKYSKPYRKGCILIGRKADTHNSTKFGLFYMNYTSTEHIIYIDKAANIHHPASNLSKNIIWTSKDRKIYIIDISNQLTQEDRVIHTDDTLCIIGWIGNTIVYQNKSSQLVYFQVLGSKVKKYISQERVSGFIYAFIYEHLLIYDPKKQKIYMTNPKTKSHEYYDYTEFNEGKNTYILIKFDDEYYAINKETGEIRKSYLNEDDQMILHLYSTTLIIDDANGINSPKVQ